MYRHTLMYSTHAVHALIINYCNFTLITYMTIKDTIITIVIRDIYSKIKLLYCDISRSII